MWVDVDERDGDRRCADGGLGIGFAGARAATGTTSQTGARAIVVINTVGIAIIVIVIVLYSVLLVSPCVCLLRRVRLLLDDDILNSESLASSSSALDGSRHGGRHKRNQTGIMSIQNTGLERSERTRRWVRGEEV